MYRLVTCGTVEEKIYRKQVFKGGLSRVEQWAKVVKRRAQPQQSNVRSGAAALAV